MKYLNKFENFEFNEDWEEVEPNKNKGPFDDQLKYGEDGPDFKCGDRVHYICDQYDKLDGKIGTVVHYYRTGGYIICFDILTKSLWGDLITYNIPDGHGWLTDCIKKI